MPGFQAGAIVGKLTLDRTQWNAAVKGVKGQTQAMGNWVKQNSAQFKKLEKAVKYTFGAVVAGITAVVMAANKQLKVEKQVEAVLDSTGHAAGMMKNEVLALAASLQKVTTYGDETILAGQNILLTFTKIGREIFPEATQIMLDMSTALGQDLKNSAIQLGKALNDPILGVTALRRVGVNFTEAQQKQIKVLVESGKTMEAQRLILEELRTEFGGSALKATESFSGSIAQLKNAFGDFLEKVGENLIPFLTNMARFFTKTFENIQGNASTFTNSIISFFKIIATAVEGLLLVFHGFQAAVFELGRGLTEGLRDWVMRFAANFAILEGLPIIGEKIKGVTDALLGLWVDMAFVSDEYKQKADAQIETMATQIDFFEKLRKTLDDVKTGFENLEFESTESAETLVNTVNPAAEKAREELLELAQTQMDLTEWTGESYKEMSETQLETFNALASGMQAGLAGVMSTIKQMVIGEMLKSLATSKLPFLAKLAMLAVTVGLVEGTFAAFMKKRAEGGRVEKGEPYLVGERGPEPFIPDRSGYIVPHGMPVAREAERPISLNIAISVQGQLDPYTSQNITRDQIIPQIISAFRSGHLLSEFKSAAKIK